MGNRLVGSVCVIKTEYSSHTMQELGIEADGNLFHMSMRYDFNLGDKIEFTPNYDGKRPTAVKCKLAQKE